MAFQVSCQIYHLTETTALVWRIAIDPGAAQCNIYKQSFVIHHMNESTRNAEV